MNRGLFASRVLSSIKVVIVGVGWSFDLTYYVKNFDLSTNNGNV